MPSKNLRELSECSTEELVIKERELAESLFRLRLRHRTNQLDNSAALQNTRRDIARVKTLLRAATMKAKA